MDYDSSNPSGAVASERLWLVSETHRPGQVC